MSHGTLKSPILDDGSFEFIPIPTRCKLATCQVNGWDCSKCPPYYSVFPRYEELSSPNGRDLEEVFAHSAWGPDFIAHSFRHHPDTIQGGPAGSLEEVLGIYERRLTASNNKLTTYAPFFAHQGTIITLEAYHTPTYIWSDRTSNITA